MATSDAGLRASGAWNVEFGVSEFRDLVGLHFRATEGMLVVAESPQLAHPFVTGYCNPFFKGRNTLHPVSS